jgi:hypothetical protein
VDESKWFVFVVVLHASNKAWSFGQMRPIFGKKTPMNGVANLSRNCAEALVARERRRTGSQMVAYHIVAQSVGTTAEWLRKFLKPNGPKEPGLTVGFNLMQVYSQVCNCVEQAGDRERKLKEDIDAALECAGLLVATTKRADRGAEKASRADPGQTK